MTIATIDIGTNTILLLVARAATDGSLETLEYRQAVARLGRSVDAQRRLHPDSMERAVRIVEEYKRIIDHHTPARVVVCGTSAVRDAANRDEFAALILKRTGFRLETLTGEEEAIWTYRGALSGVRDTTRATVVDIGGGSTEISVGSPTRVERHASLDIGSVRLTERMFRHDPPTSLELEAAIEIVEDAIARLAGFPFAGSTLVGVAGTATTLAILSQGLTLFNVSAVTNYRLSYTTVEDLFRTLREMPSSRIREMSDVMEGRNDIITAGTLVLREVMAHCGFTEMIVSERGLRYGLAVRELERVGRGE